MSNAESIFDILGTPWQGPEYDLRDARLHNWNIRPAPVYAVLPERDILMQQVAIMRTNPFDRKVRDVLGTASEDYTIIQNEDLASYMQWLGGGLGWAPYSMGALDGGRKVFFALKAPATLNSHELGFDSYLVGLNSHDGTIQLSLLLAMVDRRTGGAVTVPVAGLDPELKFPVRVLQAAPDQEEVRTFISAYDAGFYASMIHAADKTRDPRDLALGILGYSPGVADSTKARYENKLALLQEYLPQDREATPADVLVAACAWQDFASPIRKTKLGTMRSERAERALLKRKFKAEAAARALR